MFKSLFVEVKKIVANTMLMIAIIVTAGVVYLYYLADGVAEEWEKPSMVRVDVNQFDH